VLDSRDAHEYRLRCEIAEKRGGEEAAHRRDSLVRQNEKTERPGIFRFSHRYTARILMGATAYMLNSLE
jgi:hypothetical protein